MLHYRRGGGWREPVLDYKEFEYVHGSEDLATKAPFCKEGMKTEKETSSSDSSSSTEIVVDTEDEEKVEQRKETKILTKMLENNFRKEAEGGTSAGRPGGRGVRGIRGILPGSVRRHT